MHFWCSLSRDAEAGEQLAGVGLGAVAVFLGDHALELAEARALGVVEVGLCEQLVLFLESLPEALVARDHDVEHAPGFEPELVLLQHAGSLGALHVAGVRLELARQDLQERRLARAVRPGEAVATPGAEVDGHLLEQALLP